MGKDQKASDLGYHKKQGESFGNSNLITKISSAAVLIVHVNISSSSLVSSVLVWISPKLTVQHICMVDYILMFHHYHAYRS